MVCGYTSVLEETKKESHHPTPGLELRARPTDLATAPPDTQHLFHDELKEPDLIKESLHPTPGLELRARPPDIATAPPNTQHLYLDELQETDLIEQGLGGFDEEDATDVRRHTHNTRVSSEISTSTLA